MKIEIKQLQDWIGRGIVRPDEGWGDARETACLMSALTGETSIDGCVAAGWPKWLAELGTVIFDNAGRQWRERSIAFANAMAAAEARGADLAEGGDVWRSIRLNAVLPIAMEAVGQGNEPWRVQGREAVQWSIDNNGAKAAEPAWIADAAWPAWPAWAAGGGACCGGCGGCACCGGYIGV